MKTVNENHQFEFKTMCPYCEGDITAWCDGWEQDDNGDWKADHIETECSNQPDIDTDEFDDFINEHTDLPYVHIMPMQEKIKKHINERYIFDLS